MVTMRNSITRRLRLAAGGRSVASRGFGLSSEHFPPPPSSFARMVMMMIMIAAIMMMINRLSRWFWCWQWLWLKQRWRWCWWRSWCWFPPHWLTRALNVDINLENTIPCSVFYVSCNLDSRIASSAWIWRHNRHNSGPCLRPHIKQSLAPWYVTVAGMIEKSLKIWCL